jgi:hypothetical protein
MQKMSEEVSHVRQGISNESEGLMLSQKEAISSFLDEMGKIKQESIKSSERANESLVQLIESIEAKTKEVLENVHKDFDRVSKELQNWTTLTQQGLNATSAKLKESVVAFDDQKDNHEKIIEQANLNLKALIDISKSEELYSHRLESYEERTNELASAIIQLSELNQLLRVYKEKKNSV